MARSKRRGDSSRVVLQADDDACDTPAGAPAADTLIPRGRAGQTRYGLLTVLGVGGDSTLGKPVYAVGYHAGKAKWHRFALLNGGTDIVVGADIGWLFECGDVPAWASSIRLEAASVTGEGVLVEYEPLDVSGEG